MKNGYLRLSSGIQIRYIWDKSENADIMVGNAIIMVENAYNKSGRFVIITKKLNGEEKNMCITPKNVHIASPKFLKV